MGCMEFGRPPLVVAFELSEAFVADILAGVSAVVYLTELDEVARAADGSAARMCHGFGRC